MKTKTKIWIGIGAYVLTNAGYAAVAANDLALEHDRSQQRLELAQASNSPTTPALPETTQLIAEEMTEVEDETLIEETTELEEIEETVEETTEVEDEMLMEEGSEDEMLMEEGSEDEMLMEETPIEGGEGGEGGEG